MKLAEKLKTTLRRRHDLIEINGLDQHLQEHTKKTNVQNEWNVLSSDPKDDGVVELYIVMQDCISKKLR